MPDGYTLEKIDHWASDFCTSDRARGFEGAMEEYAGPVLNRFLAAACDQRGVGPEDVEEPDLKPALLDVVARLDLPTSIKRALPELCGDFLTDLEDRGRLGGGRVMGAYVRALRGTFEDAATGKPRPFTNAGTKIGRNDPCPCGSGKKYKKCCAKE